MFCEQLRGGAGKGVLADKPMPDRHVNEIDAYRSAGGKLGEGKQDRELQDRWRLCHD